MHSHLILHPNRRADPACAPDELALLRPRCQAGIGQQVENTLQCFRLEQSRDRCFQVDASLLQRTIGKCRRMKMPLRPGFSSQRPKQRSQWRAFATRGDTRDQCQRSRVQPLRGERQPRADIGIFERGILHCAAAAGERRSAAPTKPADSTTITIPIAGAPETSNAVRTNSASEKGPRHCRFRIASGG